MPHPPEHEPDQDIIPPHAPDSYGKQWRGHAGDYRHFQFRRMHLNVPVWLLLVLPVLYLLIGAVIAYAAFIGVAHYAGGLVAFVVVGACIVFGLAPLLLIAAFVGALMVWGWLWFWALLFTVPGLIMLAPHLLRAGMARYRNHRAGSEG